MRGAWFVRAGGRRALLLLAMLSAGCAVAESIQTYTHAETGLGFDYSSEWEVVDQARIQRALDRAAQDGVAVEGAEEALPRIVFSLTREVPGKDRTSWPNLMLMVMPVDAELCREINTDRYVALDAHEYVATVAGGRIAPELHVRPAAGIRGYTVVLPTQGRQLTQHRYTFCAKDQLVMLQTSSSVDEAHAMVREILATVRLDTPA